MTAIVLFSAALSWNPIQEQKFNQLSPAWNVWYTISKTLKKFEKTETHSRATNSNVTWPYGISLSCILYWLQLPRRTPAACWASADSNAIQDTPPVRVRIPEAPPTSSAFWMSWYPIRKNAAIRHTTCSLCWTLFRISWDPTSSSISAAGYKCFLNKI